ncbi:hypothetical protein PR202_gb13240 [Eleusine coracana subsp. coracana]|uniref:F-box domain-containing protein n=1 Tax=Eleusine coracana subsp. coracana TaxID=191504 RepID=A0AAV5ES16_ELECO|nr:hypothetical protein PR202_gb13240 [Eleusine coracana subsp. coracana]
MERSPDLPQDILRRIFTTLEIPDLVRAGSVCYSWRAAYTSLCSTGLLSMHQTPCLLYTETAGSKNGRRDIGVFDMENKSCEEIASCVSAAVLRTLSDIVFFCQCLLDISE